MRDDSLTPSAAGEDLSDSLTHPPANSANDNFAGHVKAFNIELSHLRDVQHNVKSQLVWVKAFMVAIALLFSSAFVWTLVRTYTLESPNPEVAAETSETKAKLEQLERRISALEETLPSNIPALLQTQNTQLQTLNRDLEQLREQLNAQSSSKSSDSSAPSPPSSVTSPSSSDNDPDEADPEPSPNTSEP